MGRSVGLISPPSEWTGVPSDTRTDRHPSVRARLYKKIACPITISITNGRAIWLSVSYRWGRVAHRLGAPSSPWSIHGTTLP